ncbi:MAG: bifunctional histidinol-phosphatase/imidazoleglycerol-phosphate dehydratase HisB [Bacteroidales bacterium]|jgi:imidazoleglycerol-phosphate dehydratase/histidinol-phosphatase|nr:bifunctional histidinol-phosphatase/imidazoleglycerol-phosphate dehydratase HisB [Bacteroidales bacterium]
MKKILFIDRDGTIVKEPGDEQLDSFDKLEFLPGAITCLSKIANETDFEMVMVTNQDGLGTETFPEGLFWPVHNMIVNILENEGVKFKEIFIDRSRPEDNAPTRKPGTAMLVKYLSQGIDLESSFVIGDRLTDIQLAKNLGCRTIYISEVPSIEAALTTTDWNDIYRFLQNTTQRAARITRKTSETYIKLYINLDGSGKSSISTGIGFFDHMLEQIPKHADIDLEIKATGDLEVDEHHTIEDVGIALGEAMLKALGSKKGIARYGFTLPMDDALATVALDFGGRPWTIWEADFKAEETGNIPPDMFFHFFKSFSDNSRCNLNINVKGNNGHHKIEAVFKAFAKALKMAVKQSPYNYKIPSTKGSL